MKRCLTGKRPAAAAAIDMAPLIDMVFLLLVFYIVSASFTRDNAVSINRPHSQNTHAAPETCLSLALTKNGAVYIDGRRAGRDRRAALTRALRGQGNKRVLIHADRAVPTGILLAVMDDCRAAGAESVDVAAVKK